MLAETVRAGEPDIVEIVERLLGKKVPPEKHAELRQMRRRLSLRRRPEAADE